jgi:hypothetical protein
MRARRQCAGAVMALSAWSMVFSVFADTIAPISTQKILDVSSQSVPTPAVDAKSGPVAWANLLPTDFSSANGVSGIPACEQAYMRRLGENPELQTAYLQFRDSGMVDTGYPEYPRRQQLIGSAVNPGNNLAADAVSANFSNLGTNLALRGRYCKTQFGSTKVTAAVGTFADDWASLASGQSAVPTRDAAAAKLEHGLGDNLKTFFTAQGYQYDRRGMPAGIASGQWGGAQSVTTGLDYRKGRFTLLGEVGGSHRDDGLQNEQESSAAAFDGSWQASNNMTFRLGHHDVGRFYTTLSGLATPGLTETYAGAKWNAASWLSLDTDMRRSLNRLATDAVARDNVSMLTSATIAIPQFVGWGFNLQALQSAGDNTDGSRNDLTNYGAAVRYATKTWQTGLGFSQGTFDKARASENGTSAGVNYDVAIFWNDVMASVPPSWNARFTFGTAYQHQDFESGLTARNSNANVGIAVQHERWGMFSAAIAHGRIGQVAGGNVDSQSYQSEFSKPLSKRHSLKFYYRQTRSVDYNAASEIRDQSGGMQFVLVQ